MNKLSRILLALMTLALALGAYAPAVSAFAATPTKTVVGIAASNPDFSTLTAAVVCTGLAPTLRNPELRFTVFAPTNEAFAKLGLNASNVCTALPKATLKNILLYHVAKGVRLADDVIEVKSIPMLNGKSTRISVVNGKAYINQAQIIATNIRATNGVVHVINAVLMP